MLLLGKVNTVAIEWWSWICRGAPCGPLRYLRFKLKRRDGSMAQHQNKWHTPTTTSAVAEDIASATGECPGRHRCIAEASGGDLGELHLTSPSSNQHTRFLAPGCALVCVRWTMPPMRKAMRMPAGGALRVCDVVRGLADGENSACSCRCGLQSPQTPPGTSNTCFASHSHAQQARRAMHTVAEMLST